MKQLLFILLAVFSVSCASVRFTGAPLNTATATAKKAPLTDVQKKQWAHLDLLRDSIPGMSIQRAYDELIKGRKGDTVIVAVIDSGIDIEHPALASVIWTNEKEVPNNGIDDDNNGYVDDIHGWNFLGNTERENLEYIRLLRKETPGSERYKEFQEKSQSSLENSKNQLGMISYLLDALPKSKDTIAAALGTTNFSLKEANDFSPKSMAYMQALSIYELSVQQNISVPLLKKAKKQEESSLAAHHNIDFFGRTNVGDNPDDWNDWPYGDGNVIGPKKSGAEHGTHVAGIIAARAGNGHQGIARQVKIMVLRAVPDGDEYDKDIARAIRYAVDHGAKVINASFGKPYSPHANWVDDALRYAAKKDVLFISGSGNDGKNIDTSENPSYPKDHYQNKEFVSNVISVGATNASYDKSQIAPFSNYGKENVDLFAPGHAIWSTIPDGDYFFFDGTSMAAPAVTGVAAVLRSFYPKYSAEKIKSLLMSSGVPLFDELTHDNTTATPKAFSKTGKLINLYNALLAASKK